MRALLTALVLLCHGTLGSLAPGQELPQRPDLVTGSLANGLRYVILEHANPPERAALYMHVSSGSLNETDEQRGLAHFLEHMAFNGSEHFEKNEVIAFFESLGLTFGQHQNAFTSFDQTTYTLELPDAQAETLDNAFLFFSDVLFGLSLEAEEIDNERPIILEEKRTSAGPQQRVREYIFERIAPGSIFGQRLPIGTEETILSMDREDFLDYYGKWYVPSNVTLMVVADADPATIVDRIEANFSRGERVPRPEDQDVGVSPYTQMRAIVASDEELRDAQIAILRISAPNSAVTTEARWRDSMVDSLASMAFNRRLEKKINEGAVAFLSASAFSSDLYEAFRISQVGSFGEPDGWRDSLRDLARELQRARLHGFTDQEVTDTKARMLSGAERAVETEPTLAARALLGQMNAAVAQSEPILSAEQRLELTQRYLDEITPREVSSRFAKSFDTSAVTFVATLPTGPDVPTNEELLALGREALKVTPDAEAESARAESLMTELPTPGTFSEPQEHEPTGVWSAELSNGAVFHHRYMDYRKDEVTVSILLAGGELREPEDQKGVTQAALLAWQRPATSELDSTQVRDLMTDKKVGVSGGASQDSLILTVSGSPADLEDGLQLAHLLLTEPVLEPPAFDQWRRATLQQIDARKLDPRGVLPELLAETLAPGEHRIRPIEKADVEALSVEAAQGWLRELLADSPIEVSVVGDIKKERAMELVARYVGSLPERSRVTPFALGGLREIDRPVGPIDGRRAVTTQTPVAVVLSGFFGPDHGDMSDRRLLRIASQIMSTRMIKRVREQEQLVYGIQAVSQPGLAYPGFGLFIAAAQTAPGSVDRLASVVDEMFGAFAAEGPSAEEMEVARGQVLNTLDEAIQEPGFWTAQLSDLIYHDRSLDEVAGMRAWFESADRESVREAFARYYTSEGRFLIRATAEGP